MRALVVDFGGSHATCGLVDDDRVVEHESVEVANAVSLEKILPRIAECFRRMLAKHALLPASCAGIAFGLPAVVDARTGAILSTRTKYEDAGSLSLSEWSRANFGLRFRIENDARMALLGENYAGAALGFENVVMMTLGTGIGGATMIEGQLLRGKHSQAGCLGGHLPVHFSGRPCCVCGAIGCAEAEASSWALPLIAKDWPNISESCLAETVDELNFEQLFRAAEAGDSAACEIRDRCLNVWGVAALAMVHAYDPEILVMGGGVLKQEAAIIPFVQNYLDKYAWTDWGKVQVKAAKLGNNAALLGAVPLLTEEFR